MAEKSRFNSVRRHDGARLVWMLLLASSALHFFWNTEADNDLWGHLLFGRAMLASGTVVRTDTYAYTTAGQPWLNHEWLSQIVMAAVYSAAGAAGLLLSKFAVAVATVLLLLSEIRRRTPSVHTQAAVGVLAIAVLARGFSIRPQIFTYGFTALLLLILEEYRRGRPRVLYLLPGIFLVWANVHGGFILGLGILALFACADPLRGPAHARRPWLVLSASVGATLLTPYGWRLFRFVENELTRAHPITEWQPTAFEVAQAPFLVMFGLFLATMVFTQDWRRDGWQSVLALSVGCLALRHQRHTPLFALCAAAPLAAQLDTAIERLGRRTTFTFSPFARRLLGVGVVALALTQLGLTAVRWRSTGFAITYDTRDYPIAAVRVLRRAGVRGNVAVPLDWGEYVLWFLAPQVKVSLDGRFATVFPERVVEDNFNLFRGAPGWQRLLDDYPTEAVLTPAGAPCPVRTLPDWRLVYRDDQAQLFVRSAAAGHFRLGAPSRDVAPPERAAGIFP
ncbi:MAG: hypothetical protein U0587_20385 [Candidatus Binatia bacterium]